MNLFKHLKNNIEQNNLHDYSALTFHNQSISYKQLLELENEKKILTSQMKSVDKEVVSQTEINFN